MPTKISWCDETINPIVGCKRISTGCDHCYAEKMAARLATQKGPAGDKYRRVIRHGKWTGVTSFDVDALLKVGTWKRKARKIFVGSMGDTWHKKTPQFWIDDVLDMAREKGQQYGHTFIFLTKRPARMLETTNRWITKRRLDTLPPWFWMMTTVENQDRFDMRAPLLLEVKAHVHGLSIEPMLGPVVIPNHVLTALDWVIVGGETGPGARVMWRMWALDVLHQCRPAGVPFFFKNWGTASGISDCAFRANLLSQSSRIEKTHEFPEVK